MENKVKIQMEVVIKTISRLEQLYHYLSSGESYSFCNDFDYADSVKVMELITILRNAK